MQTEQLIAPQTNTLHSFQGGFFRLLITPEQTGGSHSLVDMTIPKGVEPPRHLHTREDELFYILEGTVRFEIGDTVTILNPGQALFAPRNVEHQFTILTERLRLLTLVTPGDFVNYFLESGEPLATEPASVQAPQGPPPAEVVAHTIAWLNGRFGVQFA